MNQVIHQHFHSSNFKPLYSFSTVTNTGSKYGLNIAFSDITWITTELESFQCFRVSLWKMTNLKSTCRKKIHICVSIILCPNHRCACNASKTALSTHAELFSFFILTFYNPMLFLIKMKFWHIIKKYRNWGREEQNGLVWNQHLTII